MKAREQISQADAIEILKCYVHVEPTLSVENQVYRLAALSKMLFDEESSTQFQQAIIEITKYCKSRDDCQVALNHMVHDMM